MTGPSGIPALLRAMVTASALALSWPLATAADAPASKPLPKLVVFMVVDGFPQDQLVKYYDLYARRGFKLLLDDGAWFSNNAPRMHQPE